MKVDNERDNLFGELVEDRDTSMCKPLQLGQYSCRVSDTESIEYISKYVPGVKEIANIMKKKSSGVSYIVIDNDMDIHLLQPTMILSWFLLDIDKHVLKLLDIIDMKHIKSMSDDELHEFTNSERVINGEYGRNVDEWIKYGVFNCTKDDYLIKLRDDVTHRDVYQYKTDTIVVLNKKMASLCYFCD